MNSSDTQHEHKPMKTSNKCEVCGEPIHSFDGAKKSISTGGLKKTAKRLDKAANKIGFITVMVILGLLTFPLGIILWVVAAGTLLTLFSSDS